jgi:hypothetical protein
MAAKKKSASQSRRRKSWRRASRSNSANYLSVARYSASDLEHIAERILKLS